MSYATLAATGMKASRKADERMFLAYKIITQLSTFLMLWTMTSPDFSKNRGRDRFNPEQSEVSDIKSC